MSRSVAVLLLLALAVCNAEVSSPKTGLKLKYCAQWALMSETKAAQHWLWRICNEYVRPGVKFAQQMS